MAKRKTKKKQTRKTRRAKETRENQRDERERAKRSRTQLHASELANSLTTTRFSWPRKSKRFSLEIRAKKVTIAPKEEVKRELKISAIEEGTVIDHIPTDATFKVVEILDLENHDGVVSIATNLQSKKIGKKGIIKVGGKSLTQSEVNKIAIVAPDATVNIIKNYNVKEKIKVKTPDVIDNVVKCSNPVCITNSEQVPTKFYVVKKDPLKIKCHYCERSMSKEDIKII